MRKSFVILLFAVFSATSFANEGDMKTNLFTCVEEGTLALKSECIESTMTANPEFQVTQNLDIIGDNLGENEMATMRFYPEKMLIEIVAHADNIDGKDLTAKVD